MLRKALTVFLFLHVIHGFAQDTIRIGEKGRLLNRSISNKFTLFESKENIDFDAFVSGKSAMEERKLLNPVENIDFTTSTFFIDFVIENNSAKDIDLVLETARPITNEASVKQVSSAKVFNSGDEVPFFNKVIRTNKSAIPLKIKAGHSERFILKLRSDGEIISLPFILWDESSFEIAKDRQQFFLGIFYGIFLFVIIIYLNFYILLRDVLFLLYCAYVLASGLLQFALDGYVHQFIFTNGAYFTQHSVIFIAGITVFTALQYASRYLKLKGRTRLLTNGFSIFVLLIIGASLIPGKPYEICYPLINGLSLLAVVYLLIVAFRIRRTNESISPLFLIGLFALLTGAVIFILGNFSIIDIPVITQNALKTGTLIEIICLSILMAGKYKALQEEKEEAQRQLLVELEEKNELMSQANIRLEEEVAQRTREIEEQRVLLKEKNDDYKASITYAERIQRALLSNEKRFKATLSDSFIFYRPKDIVSGDFFWIEKVEPTRKFPNGLIAYATADCTGHGVPGAFVSIICNNLLKLGKNHEDVQDPGTALDFVNREITGVLNSNYGTEQIRDGMDVSLCAIDPKTKLLYFAGAKNGIYILRDSEIIEFKGDRSAIGFTETPDEKFTTHQFQLQSGDVIYSLSDGYVDQFGGKDNKKFTSRRFKEMLLEIAKMEMEEQLNVVQNTFEQWLGEHEQIDDVLVIGVRIS